MDIQLYVHIPFCVRKCLYCDFASTDAPPCSPDEYVDALLQEMELRRESVPVGVSAATLYFGGGTPSLLEPRQVERIVAGASTWYGLSGTAEVTLEANPGTIDAQRCRAFRAAGINRLSLGVQSFDDALLKTLGRVHSSAEAVAAFKAADSAGFASVGIDLIHSLPGQTVTMLENDLSQVVALSPGHVSAYGLTVEPETPFGEMHERDTLQLPPEDDAVEMFRCVADVLVAAGYEHYEISNFARSGCRSRHNEGYWRRCTYLGFGAGAHSFLADTGERWGNAADIVSYLKAMRSGRLPAEESVHLDPEAVRAEFMFLGLRLLEGVSLSVFTDMFHLSVEAAFPQVEGLISRGLLVREGDSLRLHPSAVIISNQIFSRFV